MNGRLPKDQYDQLEGKIDAQIRDIGTATPASREFEETILDGLVAGIYWTLHTLGYDEDAIELETYVRVTMMDIQHGIY